MKKLFYYVLPLLCLPLNSCTPTEKVFSREALPKEITEAEIIAIKGFKNRFYYLDSQFNEATTNSYSNQGLLVDSQVAKINQQGYISGNNFIEYKYNESGLLLSEKDTLVTEDGPRSVNLHTVEYDKYQNPIQDRQLTYIPEEGYDDDDGIITYSSYTYDTYGKITKIDQNVFNNGTHSFKSLYNFSYDEKHRLVKTERRTWDENFDDPDAYTRLYLETHIYDGHQIIDITETTQYIGTTEEEQNKIMKICDYDSNYNLIHSLIYVYATNNIEKISEKIENFYEYNNKNLETLYKSNVYDMTDIPPNPTRVVYRTTNYCGPNNNQIESRISISCVPGDKTGNIIYTNVHNYFDEKWNVVEQEIDTNDNIESQQSIKTYYFEY